MDKANQNKETVPDQPVEIVNTAEALENLIVRVKRAQKEFATFSQEQVNAIFKAAAAAADKARIPLAKMAVEDTGMGIVEDKIIKTILLPNIFITNTKTKRPAASSRQTVPTASKSLPNRWA